jgi:anti-sigma-K factor RskA
MSDDRTISGEDGQLLAAEYVLGVLDAGQRRYADRLAGQDPAFAAEIRHWEERLGGLAAEVSRISPPPKLWDCIDAALPRRPRRHLWNSLPFWRWSALASAGLAAASLAGVYFTALSSPRGPLVATLEASGQPGFVAAIDPDRNSITIVPASLTAANQRALELWVIVPGDRPRSLGVIEPGKAVRVSVPASLTAHMQVDAALAVTLEPEGGSPSGLPTGPVIASGKLTNL